MNFPECSLICPEGAYQILIDTEKEIAGAARIRPGDLARWMERATEAHLESYGLSRAGLKAEGKIWVISWTSIDILRMPQLGEQLLLRLWPGKPRGGMYSRRYAFCTVSGEPLACAASLFALMDSQTRKMAEGTGQVKAIPVVTQENEQPLPKMRMNFPEQADCRIRRTVTPEEIDLNGHLNNTHYIDWAEDVLDTLGASESGMKSLWIQYSRELKEGQEVVLACSLTEEALYIRGLDHDTEAFLAKIQIKE